jgi:hypothetical protein
MEEKKEFWAVVELMGHAKLAGLVTEVEMGGAKLLRVDVPDVPERPAERYYAHQEAIPGYTRFVGGSAIYAITPMTEEVCRKAAEQFRISPVHMVGMAHIERVVVRDAPKQLLPTNYDPGSDADSIERAARILEERCDSPESAKNLRTYVRRLVDEDACYSDQEVSN